MDVINTARKAVWCLDHIYFAFLYLLVPYNFLPKKKKKRSVLVFACEPLHCCASFFTSLAHSRCLWISSSPSPYLSSALPSCTPFMSHSGTPSPVQQPHLVTSARLVLHNLSWCFFSCIIFAVVHSVYVFIKWHFFLLKFDFFDYYFFNKFELITQNKI